MANTAAGPGATLKEVVPQGLSISSPVDARERSSWAPGDDVTPYVKHSAYRRQSEEWPLIAALCGGTKAMRAMRRELLPQEPKESDPKYNNRLARSFLHPGFSDAVDDLSDRPFVKAIEFKNEPDGIKKFLNNASGQGQTFSDVCRDWMKAALKYGVAYAEVDHTYVPPSTNAADEEKLDPRAFMKVIGAPSLLFWIVRASDGKLDRVHILETGNLEDGSEVQQVKVWTRTTWEIWRSRKENEKEVWYSASNGVNSLGEVPVVAVYFERVGVMEARPPLLGLAYTNLAHWQSSSDQRNGLRFARIGILFGSGIKKGDLEEQLDDGISPSSLIVASSEQANLRYVEHQGKALEYGFTDLRRLEMQMQQQGVQPLVDRMGEESATGKAIDDKNATSSMNTWVRRLDAAATEACRLAEKWKKRELPKEFTLTIYNDFILPSQGGTILAALAGARAIRDISRSTYLSELRRHGALAEDFDAEADKKELDKEALELDLLPDRGKDPKKDPDGRIGGADNAAGA